MKEAQKLFTPLGVDHITFAVYDRHFWKKILEQFGFVEHKSRVARKLKETAMVQGNLRVILVDPKSNDFDNTAYGPNEITSFLIKYGDFQVYSATILVDNIFSVQRELRDRDFAFSFPECCLPVTSPDIGEDAFGVRVGLVNLRSPDDNRMNWQLIQRKDVSTSITKSQMNCEGVDHFAIGVRNLEEWENLYHFLGFETIYKRTHEKIHGKHSGMNTAAVQRGGWVIALVEGVNYDLPSQVTTYVEAHGDHAVQHAAIRFADLAETVEELQRRGAQIRTHRAPEDLKGDLTDFIHYGRDHSGSLLQCFTKPWATKGDKGGFFFELIQRVGQAHKAEGDVEAFHDPTVRGLYESIEDEELREDGRLIFPEELMEGYRFQEWLAKTKKEGSHA